MIMLVMMMVMVIVMIMVMFGDIYCEAFHSVVDTDALTPPWCVASNHDDGGDDGGGDDDDYHGVQQSSCKLQSKPALQSFL